jgi:hypothetical protein
MLPLDRGERGLVIAAKAVAWLGAVVWTIGFLGLLAVINQAL